MASPMGERKLSTNLLGMKFMKRKEESEAASKLEQERAKQIKEAQWVANENAGALSLEEKKILFAAEKKSGRKSFGNFNPAIEKLTSEPTKSKEEEKIRFEKLKEQENMSEQDKAWAERYQNYVQNDGKSDITDSKKQDSSSFYRRNQKSKTLLKGPSSSDSQDQVKPKGKGNLKRKQPESSGDTL